MFKLHMDFNFLRLIFDKLLSNGTSFIGHTFERKTNIEVNSRQTAIPVALGSLP